MKKKILIGIDDTDNKESRGTGYLSRKLAKHMHDKRLAEVQGITRHQLFVHPQVPYTSQNSSACLSVITSKKEDLIKYCRSFLVEESAEGSDVGLAIVESNLVAEEVEKWGIRAKKELLTQKEAKNLALKYNVFLEGLTGTKDGIIGSMAAVGLRKGGNDGRFIWLKGIELRDLKGLKKIGDLKAVLMFDAVLDKNYNFVPDEAIIDVGEWLRPVLYQNKICIIAERKENSKNNEWKVATKDYIKSISD